MKKDERTSVRCGFRGRPEPSISWLYNGEELSITGGLLTLSEPRAGVYQCLARNPYGTAQASIALVLPQQMLGDELEAEIPVKKSLIVFGPNNVTVSEGETVQLHCLTEAAATVQWLHNDEIINFNLMRRYEMLPSGGLRIVSAQKSDAGVYECLASKIGFGTSSARCEVHVQGLALTLPGQWIGVEGLMNSSFSSSLETGDCSSPADPVECRRTGLEDQRKHRELSAHHSSSIPTEPAEELVDDGGAVLQPIEPAGRGEQLAARSSVQVPTAGLRRSRSTVGDQCSEASEPSAIGCVTFARDHRCLGDQRRTHQCSLAGVFLFSSLSEENESFSL